MNINVAIYIFQYIDKTHSVPPSQSILQDPTAKANSAAVNTPTGTPSTNTGAGDMVTLTTATMVTPPIKLTDPKSELTVSVYVQPDAIASSGNTGIVTYGNNMGDIEIKVIAGVLVIVADGKSYTTGIPLPTDKMSSVAVAWDSKTGTMKAMVTDSTKSTPTVYTVPEPVFKGQTISEQSIKVGDPSNPGKVKLDAVVAVDKAWDSNNMQDNFNKYSVVDPAASGNKMLELNFDKKVDGIPVVQTYGGSNGLPLDVPVELVPSETSTRGPSILTIAGVDTGKAATLNAKQLDYEVKQLPPQDNFTISAAVQVGAKSDQPTNIIKSTFVDVEITVVVVNGQTKLILKNATTGAILGETVPVSIDIGVTSNVNIVFDSTSGTVKLMVKDSRGVTTEQTIENALGGRELPTLTKLTLGDDTSPVPVKVDNVKMVNKAQSKQEFDDASTKYTSGSNSVGDVLSVNFDKDTKMTVHNPVNGAPVTYVTGVESSPLPHLDTTPDKLSSGESRGNVLTVEKSQVHVKDINTGLFGEGTFAIDVKPSKVSTNPNEVFTLKTNEGDITVKLVNGQASVTFTPKSGSPAVTTGILAVPTGSYSTLAVSVSSDGKLALIVSDPTGTRAVSTTKIAALSGDSFQVQDLSLGSQTNDIKLELDGAKFINKALTAAEVKAKSATTGNVNSDPDTVFTMDMNDDKGSAPKLTVKDVFTGGSTTREIPATTSSGSTPQYSISTVPVVSTVTPDLSANQTIPAQVVKACADFVDNSLIKTACKDVPTATKDWASKSCITHVSLQTIFLFKLCSFVCNKILTSVAGIVT